MALLDGEPSGKVGSLCKRFLKAFTLLFISICKMWVRIRALAMGSLTEGSELFTVRRQYQRVAVNILRKLLAQVLDC
jgi:hypothetical protein